jgi:two-component system, cell cycle response regulator
MAANPDRLRVLVVDDSPVARKLVEVTLPTDQYEVHFAKTGLEGLKAFAEIHPGLVITDWLMPDVSGPEICERIRGESRGPYTYIILLTSIASKDDVVSGLRAGADEYLTKPFDGNELLARVAVGRRIVSLHRELEAKNRLLEELALTDKLTNLPNRHAVDTWGTKQLSGAVRHDFSFWAILADLDQFKGVNDAFGHDAGDLVLKKFAEILRANVRTCDICGRLGGDEFLILIAHCDRDGVETLVGRVRQQLQNHEFVFGGVEIRVYASFGIAGIHRASGEDLPQIIARADVALYQAKRLGRNRIHTAMFEIPTIR